LTNLPRYENPCHEQIYNTFERAPTGFKKTKHRITVLGWANAAEIHKINSAVTKESQDLRYFKGVHNLPAHYDTNKEAWVTREIFSVWFHNNFVPAA